MAPPSESSSLGVDGSANHRQAPVGRLAVPPRLLNIVLHIAEYLRQVKVFFRHEGVLDYFLLEFCKIAIWHTFDQEKVAALFFLIYSVMP